MGIRCADHVTPLYPQKLALTSPTGGGRSVGIVRSLTKATEFSLVFITKTHYVSRVHSVATVLCLQFVLRVMLFHVIYVLYFYISTSWKYMCSAQYGCFCGTLISCFPSMLHRHCLNDFEIVPVVPTSNGITFALPSITTTTTTTIMKVFQEVKTVYA